MRDHAASVNNTSAPRMMTVVTWTMRINYMRICTTHKEVARVDSEHSEGEMHPRPRPINR